MTESTGIPGLDDVTSGLPPHALTLVIGPPGTGKTIFAMQFGMHHASQGKDVVFFSAYSEAHERLYAQLGSFSFFDPEIAGERITMLSLKSVLQDSPEKAVETVLQAVRGRKEPLLIIDGFRGLAQRLGTQAAQDLLSGLGVQLPYYHARALIAFEAMPGETEPFFELAAADVLIALRYTLQGAQALRSLEVLKIRGHGFRQGLHGMAFTDVGIVVYPRLITCLPDTTPPPSPRRLQFDLAGFDAMLGGGLPEFSTTVLVGDVGTGRTTFGLHYLLAGARVADSGLMLTLQDTAVDLLQKADDLGLPLRAEVDAGRIIILQIPPVEIEPDRLAWRVRELVHQHRVTRLVIDSISDLEAVPSVLLGQGDYLTGLSVYLRRTGVTTVMIQDTAIADVVNPTPRSARMPVANNRVLLRRVAHMGRLYRICSVLTMQRSRHDSEIREFVIGEGGVRVLDVVEADAGILSVIKREQQVTPF